MSKPSKYWDSRTKSLIGFSKNKRDYAKEFGVDVSRTYINISNTLDFCYFMQEVFLEYKIV